MLKIFQNDSLTWRLWSKVSQSCLYDSPHQNLIPPAFHINPYIYSWSPRKFPFTLTPGYPCNIFHPNPALMRQTRSNIRQSMTDMNVTTAERSPSVHSPPRYFVFLVQLSRSLLSTVQYDDPAANGPLPVVFALVQIQDRRRMGDGDSGFVYL